MEDNNVMIDTIKDAIKTIKLDIIEKMNKLDELLDSIDNLKENSDI